MRERMRSRRRMRKDEGKRMKGGRRRVSVDEEEVDERKE